MNTNKSYEIRDVLLNLIELGESEIGIINSAIGLIHQITPIDGAQLFARMESVISISDDLEWIINSINRKKISKENEIRKIKDPKYVALVRQGRPSGAAIEAEIRISMKDIREDENALELISSILDYLQTVQKGLDRYLSVLKLKATFMK